MQIHCLMEFSNKFRSFENVIFSLPMSLVGVDLLSYLLRSKSRILRESALLKYKETYDSTRHNQVLDSHCDTLYLWLVRF